MFALEVFNTRNNKKKLKKMKRNLIWFYDEDQKLNEQQNYK